MRQVSIGLLFLAQNTLIADDYQKTVVLPLTHPTYTPRHSLVIHVTCYVPEET